MELSLRAASDGFRCGGPECTVTDHPPSARSKATNIESRAHRRPRRHSRRLRRIYLRRRIVVVLLLMVIIGAPVVALTRHGGIARASAGSQHPSTHHQVAQVMVARSTARGVSRIIRLNLTFIDSTRSTYSYTSGMTTPGRRLRVQVWHSPAWRAVTNRGANQSVDLTSAPPLIVFAPGYDASALRYTPLLKAWVAAGFLVAVIGFPDTTPPASTQAYSLGLPFGSPESDMVNEPADVAFVIHELISSDTNSATVLTGRFDPTKIVLAGHSDGANVMGALLYDGLYRSLVPSVRGVMLLSGAPFVGAAAHYDPTESPSIPALVVQSDADLCNAPAQGRELYDDIGAAKLFLELHGASHLGAYNDADVNVFAEVVASTVAFTHHLVGGGSPQVSWLASLLTQSVATLSSGAIAPEIAPPKAAPTC